MNASDGFPFVFFYSFVDRAYSTTWTAFTKPLLYDWTTNGVVLFAFAAGSEPVPGTLAG